ncbi:MAG: hypothetical protein M0P59_15065 [Gallionella sp.]|jgi:hypothetical protein|nr:hypothetical protein [Gallionella sp.]MCK9355450.1 hypothetical protein [Gallionella sp.]
MNENIHHEFAYQSRELGIQIEDTLGDPPDHRTYAQVVASLIDEYAKGTEIDDVNLLSFALVEHLCFDDPAGLFAQCKQYDGGDAVSAVSMVSCAHAGASKALAAVAAKNPELARKAIVTAFLFKNAKRWSGADESLDALQEEEDNFKNMDDEEELERNVPGQDVIDLFDKREDGNG